MEKHSFCTNFYYCYYFYGVYGCCFQAATNPDNSVFDVKRLIGRQFDDPSVQSDMKLWPFQLVNVGGKPKIRVEYKSKTKTFSPEEISTMVLVKMKAVAEAYLGKVYIDGCEHKGTMSTF